VVGSTFGTGPYEQLESKLRQVGRRPDVQETVEQVRIPAEEQMEAVAQRVGDKLAGPGGTSDETPIALTAQWPEFYANPRTRSSTRRPRTKRRRSRPSRSAGTRCENPTPPLRRSLNWPSKPGAVRPVYPLNPTWPRETDRRVIVSVSPAAPAGWAYLRIRVDWKERSQR
jgi:hypothetical protein